MELLVTTSLMMHGLKPPKKNAHHQRDQKEKKELKVKKEKEEEKEEEKEKEAEKAEEKDKNNLHKEPQSSRIS